MKRRNLLSACLAVLLLAAIASAQAPPPPLPAPLSVDDVVLLLQMKVPRERIEKFLDQSGVEFRLDGEIGTVLIKAGGDKALLGAIALAPYFRPRTSPPQRR